MPSLNELISFMHSTCLNWSPNSEYQELSQGIVCGSNLTISGFHGVFQKSGLLHIIIVSGSHLVFLSEILNRLQIKNRIIHCLILVPYVIICRLEAPALRSFFVFLLQTTSQYFRMNTSPFYIHLFSLVFCLILFPSWYKSLSLGLSLVASLGLALSKKHSTQCTLIFFMVLPFLFFTKITALSLWNNIFLAPFVGGILFPANLVSFIIPPLSLVSDALWWMLIQTISFIESLWPYKRDQIFTSRLNYEIQWIYICLLLLLLRKRP